MVTPENNLQLLQALIDRHPRDLSIILKALGVSDPLSPEAMITAYKSDPDQFINLLTQLPEEKYDGDPKLLYSEIFNTATSNMTGSDNTAEKKDSKKWIWIISAVVVIGLITAFIISRSSKTS